jgi:peptidoglycan/xylan/chitin deacetylase (PgdA/CDA1 family)
VKPVSPVNIDSVGIENPVGLMYHDVTLPGDEDTSGFPGGDAARYKLSPRQFDDHLSAIARRMNLAPLLTFDDGGSSARLIADKLDSRGWRGSFFITAGYIDRPGFLTRSGIRDLRRRGHTIGSHSWSHPRRMAHCLPARIDEEWTRSIASLADIVGEPIAAASVPGGDFSARVAVSAEAAGIRSLFVSHPTRGIRSCGELRVFGRYAVQRSTSARRAAAVAAGASVPRWEQLVWWEIKAIGKAVAGPAYLRIRDRVLGRSEQIRWGDEIVL